MKSLIGLFLVIGLSTSVNCYRLKFSIFSELGGQFFSVFYVGNNSIVSVEYSKLKRWNLNNGSLNLSLTFNDAFSSSSQLKNGDILIARYMEISHRLPDTYGQVRSKDNFELIAEFDRTQSEDYSKNMYPLTEQYFLYRRGIVTETRARLFDLNLNRTTTDWLLLGKIIDIKAIDEERVAIIQKLGFFMIKIFNFKTGQLLSTLEVGSTEALALAVMDNGSRLAVVYAGKLKIFDLKTYQKMSEIAYNDYSPNTRFSFCVLNKDLLILAGNTGSFYVYDTNFGILKYQAINPHSDLVSSIIVLDEGRFATGSYDGTLMIWNSTTFELSYVIDDNPDFLFPKIFQLIKLSNNSIAAQRYDEVDVYDSI